MYRVRFHLKKGENYLKWQVKNMETGNVEYYNPEETLLILQDCRLINKRQTAEKINRGEHKTVCAWIECRTVNAYVEEDSSLLQYRVPTLFYNPKKFPYWVDSECRNVDNRVYRMLLTKGRQLCEN
jgi:hypothetical protein